MPKETRKIAGSIRVNGQVFTNDNLDEVEAALSADQISRLTEKGVIEGFGAKAPTAEKAEPKQAPKAEK